jgi:hypothetical protein
MISESEMQDFNNVISEAGFDPDDFNPIAVEDEPSGPGVQPITGTVTVHRQSTDQATTYTAGHGSTWVAQFATHLQGGEFGNP